MALVYGHRLFLSTINNEVWTYDWPSQRWTNLVAGFSSGTNPWIWVHAISAHEAIAVSDYAGQIRRWKHGAWTDESIAPTIAALNFNFVWANSANDIYAVGNDQTLATWEAVVYHYDGTSWSKMASVPQGAYTKPHLQGAWSDGTNLWCCGSQDYISSRSAYGYIVKWDGASWTTEVSGTTYTHGLLDIHGHDSTHVSAVGQWGSPVRPKIVTWNGATWDAEQVGAETSAGYESNSVLYVAADDIVVGCKNQPATGESQVWRKRNSTWTKQTIPETSGVTSHGNLAAASASRIYACGGGAAASEVLLYDGATWAVLEQTSALPDWINGCSLAQYLYVADEQYRPVTTFETAGLDSLSVRTLRDMASAANNAKAFALAPKLIMDSYPEGCAAYDADTTEYVVRVFAKRIIPAGYRRLVWYAGHARTSGADGVRWRLYASTNVYTGPVAFDADYLAAGYASDYFDCESDTHGINVGSFSLPVIIFASAKGRELSFVLTSTCDAGTRGKLTTLDAILRVEGS